MEYKQSSNFEGMITTGTIKKGDVIMRAKEAYIALSDQIEREDDEHQSAYVLVKDSSSNIALFESFPYEDDDEDKSWGLRFGWEESAPIDVLKELEAKSNVEINNVTYKSRINNK